MNTVTALIYWLIVSLWLAVLVTVCTAYYRNPRTFGTTRLLLAVVGIDTTRNVIENLYFGFYFGGQYGLFPRSVFETLGNPQLLILPKLVNVIAACVVLGVLLLRWLPLALAERRSADLEAEQKSAALNQEIEKRQRIFETSQIALLESEQMARGIIETALDAFVQFDKNEIVVDWSRQAERLFGITRDAALGARICTLVGSKWDSAADEETFNRFLQNQSYSSAGERFQLSAKGPDGADVRIEISLTSLERQQGIVFNGFARDITNRLLAENQIRQAQKMEAVGQLTGGVAHDFNNILTIITGTIEILAEAVADRPEMASIANMIDEAAERGADLTRHLLAFARKQPLQPRQIDIEALLVAAGKFIRPALGEQVEIEITSRPNTWPAFVDPNQLTTTVLNLAINARDAMPRGGKLVIEALNCHLDQDYADQHDEVSPGDYVMVAVSDTGTGIPRHLVEKVFEPFFTTKEVGKGTGLGLSMVYGFVKQSGGHIKIYSELGHGTTVKIYLPRGSDVVDETSNLKSVERVESGSELILIVEDDTMVRKYVIAQIQSLGYRTLDAVNAADAIELIRNHPDIDLLFTDIIMPGAMNGRDLAKAALTARPDLGIVYTSGYTENAIVHHGRLDEGVLLLAKPYRKAELSEMLRTALRRR